MKRAVASEILDQAKALRSKEREGAAVRLDELLRSASVREVLELASEARLRFVMGLWPQYVALDVPVLPSLVDELPTSGRLAVTALMTTHRSGYVRELGLEAITASRDPVVIPFLLLRCDDIVDGLRQRAERAVLARLRPELATEFARCIRLLELLAGRKRGSTLVYALRDYLARSSAALQRVSREGDATERRLAFELRLASEPRGEVLREALGDRAITVHAWAARGAMSGKTDLDDQRRLLSLLASSPSARIRSLAVRRAQQLEGTTRRIELALLDHNAGVRLGARHKLRALEPERHWGETRVLALSVLSQPGASARRLIGGLGAIADVGHPEDLVIVERFLSDPRASVRREAERTWNLLGGAAAKKP